MSFDPDSDDLMREREASSQENRGRGIIRMLWRLCGDMQVMVCCGRLHIVDNDVLLHLI